MDLKTYIGELNRCKLQYASKPIPANIAPRLKKFYGIKAVLCDVYGTLLIGKSNSVGDLERGKEDPKQFNKVIKEFNFKNALLRINKNPSKVLKGLYLEEIKKVHERKKKKGIVYPEMLIENVWKSIIKKLTLNGYSYNKKIYGNLREFSFKVAYFYYHAEGNHTFYHNAFNVLESLKNYGIVLGLVSNSQFCTPINLDIEIKRNSGNKAGLYDLFDKNFIGFSYKVGQSKPGKEIFKKVLNNLKAKKIKKQQTIFIGNDINNDIKPANEIGFKTVLFAGDKNTLKFDTKIKSDAIITNWSQLLKII